MRRDVVVIGTSAGGVQALRQLLSGLPPDLAAAVFIVLHISDTAEGRLAMVLSRSSRLPVANAQEGDAVEAGRVLVAPPGCHLLLRDGAVQVRMGPRENGVRPSIDVLFRSAALTFGPRVVAVILTGLLDDGSQGLREVVARGGIAVVQEPSTAAFPSMPEHAISAGGVTHVVELRNMAEVITGLLGQPVSTPDPAGSKDAEESGSDIDELSLEVAISAGEPPIPPGRPSAPPSWYTCPDCSGVLQEYDTPGFPRRFRCRVGHGWSARSLLRGKNEQFEDALWTAIHLLEERSQLCLRMARDAEREDRPRSARQLRTRSEEAAARVAALRGALFVDQAPDGLAREAADAESDGKVADNAFPGDGRVLSR